jgi:hypothetical protein
MFTVSPVFYSRITINDVAFPNQAQMVFPYEMTHVVISRGNENVKIDFSFLRPHLHGELFCYDQPISFDGLNVGKLWFRADTQAEVRVWAWRK